MTAGGRQRHGFKMPCESCAVQFSVFKRKRVCCECERYYCSGCLRRGGGAMCAPCRALSTRPLYRNTIAHLKVRDLQCFLHRQNVSTRGCVEKEELVTLCVSHVNSAGYRRRGAGGGAGGGAGAGARSGAFSSLKGFTNNINDFINNAFDLRPSPPPSAAQPQPNSRGCFNSSHTHRAPSPISHSGPPRPPERFTTTPGGEPDIEVPVPPADVSRTSSAESTHVETADCFEIEDLDDGGWELVTKPADPLPNDSDILISAADALRRDSQHTEPPIEPRPPPDPPSADHQVRHSTHAADAASRAADARLSYDSRNSPQSDFETIPEPPTTTRPTISSDYLTPGLSSSSSRYGGAGGGLSSSTLELRHAGSSSPDTDTCSLKDELTGHSTPASPRATAATTLEEMRDVSELEALSVKQLKELLARNRVEYRGCVERRELLERAERLWRELCAQPHVDDLPLEDACKICMAAPLECVLLECGHIAACTACSKQLAECPICRQYVVRAVRFFRS